jgi:hypothetical protein
MSNRTWIQVRSFALNNIIVVQGRNLHLVWVLVSWWTVPGHMADLLVSVKDIVAPRSTGLVAAGSDMSQVVTPRAGLVDVVVIKYSAAVREEAELAAVCYSLVSLYILNGGMNLQQETVLTRCDVRSRS